MNFLRTLEKAVPQGVHEPQCMPKSVQKILVVLNKTPKHLQLDLVMLVPKLIDISNHSLAAYAMLEHLQKPNVKPTLHLHVCLLEL